MADNPELIIELNTKVDKANRQISRFSDTATKQAKSVEKAFTGLKVVAGAAVAAFAGGKILGAINKTIDAAKIQEDAVNSLNTSLKLAGDFSEDASKSFQTFASDLQKVTTVGDETTLKLAGLAKNFGLNNERTKDLTRAAIELSAATGINLESAITNLGKSTGGLVGELGESIPALKGLSKEALESGVAIDFVLERFGGAAASKLNTFSGATTALGNAFGDVQERIGEIVTSNQAVIIALNSIRGAFEDLGEAIGENQSAVSLFVTKSVEFLSGFAIFSAEVFNKVVAGVTNFIISLKETNIAIAEFQQKYLGADLKEFIAGQQAAIDKNVRFRDSVKETTDTIIIRAAETIGQIKKIGDETEKSSGKAEKALDKPKKAIETLGDSAKDTKDEFNAMFDSLDKVARRTDEMSDAQVKGMFDRKTLRSAQSGYEEFLKNQEKKTEKQAETVKNIFGQEFTSDEIARNQNISGKAAGGLGMVLNGKEGAKQAVGAAGGALADSFFPGSGQAVNQILQLLSGGPDQVKAQIEAFVDQLPVVIDAIVEAIPVVIDALAEHSDTIAVSLAEAFVVKIPVAVAKGVGLAVGRFLNNVVREFSNIFQGSVMKGFSAGISNALASVQQAFEDAAKPFRDLGSTFRNLVGTFTEFINKVVAVINSLSLSGKDGGFQIGGTLGQTTESAKKVFGFETGLTEVPSGFPNDSFGPVGLTSGEGVIDARTNPKLNKFLDSWERGDSGKRVIQQTIILQLGQEQLATAMRQLEIDGFETGAA